MCCDFYLVLRTLLCKSICLPYIIHIILSLSIGAVNTSSDDRLHLIRLRNTTATCNDGTSAGFYFRKGNETGSNQRWIVFLEGGSQCWDKRSCTTRAKKRPGLMSSKTWQKSRRAPALLSRDPELNPYWYSAHHVLVPYCSSDSWAGSRTKGQPFVFAGRLILKRVLSELVSRGMKGRLILAGSSAGGVGAMLNAERTRRSLRPLGIKVAIVADSAWFLDRPSRASRAPAAETVARLGHTMWRGTVPASCARAYPTSPWSCYFGYRLYPHLRARTFVVQWLFDTAQLAAEGVRSPRGRADWEAARETCAALRESLTGVRAAFAPACVAHGALSRPDWSRVTVNGVHLAKALHCWESRGGCAARRLVEKCSWPQCGSACPRIRDPRTGEEMGPAALLQSFGLDVKSAAAARGLAAHQVARMSCAELLPLLAPKR